MGIVCLLHATSILLGSSETVNWVTPEDCTLGPDAATFTESTSTGGMKKHLPLVDCGPLMAQEARVRGHK